MPNEEHNDGGNCSDSRKDEEREKPDSVAHALVSRSPRMQPRNETENPVTRARGETCINNRENERKRVVE